MVTLLAWLLLLGTSGFQQGGVVGGHDLESVECRLGALDLRERLLGQLLRGGPSGAQGIELGDERVHGVIVAPVRR